MNEPKKQELLDSIEPRSQVLLLNQVKCNICNEIITSKHRHDYVSCNCGNLHIDGGIDYAKRSFITADYTDMSVFADEDDIAVIREYLTWNSYGVNGDEPCETRTIAQLDTDHIEAILRTQFHIKGTFMEKVFTMELEYRKGNQ